MDVPLAQPHAGFRLQLSLSAGDHIARPGGIALLPAAASTKHYRQGETVSEEGTANLIGYVHEGAVKLVKTNPEGHVNILSIIEGPGFFGRMFGITADYAVEAATDVVLSTFDRSRFEVLLANNPELEHIVHMHALYQLEEAHARILVLACQTTMARTATYLLLRMLAWEASHNSECGGAIVDVTITRRDLAAYLGTTVETISRNLQALSRRGTIEIIDSARFRIARRSDLFAIAGHDEQDVLDVLPRPKPPVANWSIGVVVPQPRFPSRKMACV